MTNRRNIKHPIFFEYIEDILYFTLIIIFTVKFIIFENDGIFRGFIIYGMIGGAIVYFLLIDKVIRPVHTFIIDCFKELIKFILYIFRWIIMISNKMVSKKRVSKKQKKRT